MSGTSQEILNTSSGSGTKIRLVQALAAGPNTILYGTPIATAPALVEVRDDGTGDLISCNVSSETINGCIITIAVAVASARITIIG